MRKHEPIKYYYKYESDSDSESEYDPLMPLPPPQPQSSRPPMALPPQPQSSRPLTPLRPPQRPRPMMEEPACIPPPPSHQMPLPEPIPKPSSSSKYRLKEIYFQPSYSILYSTKSGPQFGSNDIYIGSICNFKDSCWISLTNTFNCHPHYKSSLFVNTAGPNEMNKFEVLDYEVYAYNQPVKLSNN